MRLCNSWAPEECLVCHQTSQHNWVIIVRINPRHIVDHSRTKQSHEHDTEIFLTRFTDMATSPGHDYGRSSPWHRHNTAPGRPGHRHKPPASPAFRCYYIGIGYIVCLPTLYMRGLGYKCPTRTQLHILSKHNTTTSPTVTYLVHYIRHNSNKLHLGEYSPPL